LFKEDNLIKAIETHYNGYKFRSRLEARWAVFLDDLFIKWDYEIEGFETENGLRYLPDFLIHNDKKTKLLLEVTGEEIGFNRIKIDNFVNSCDGKFVVVVVFGDPYNYFDQNDKNKMFSRNALLFTNNGVININTFDLFYVLGFVPWHISRLFHPEVCEKDRTLIDQAMEIFHKSAELARQRRFEFGE
jgi:hypothetical protein